MYRPFESYFMGTSPLDGTIDFYLRVGSLGSPERIYLDYGARRGGWLEDDAIETRRSIRDMRNKFGTVIAADVDPAVLRNKSADRVLLIEKGFVPLEDESVDVIAADFVMEHIQHPDDFAREMAGILRPGGWFCARTPHKAHYVAFAERHLPSIIGSRLLHKAQPKRKEEDIFPKHYKINTISDARKLFPSWESRSFCRRTDPAYYFGRRFAYVVIDFAHRVLPVQLSGVLFIFMQKPEAKE